MPNICFLLGGFQGNGGIGRVTSILANELCKDGDYNVFTLSYLQTGAPMLYPLSESVRRGALFSSGLSMTKAMLFKHAVKRVKTFIKENDIDILVACGALYFPLGILAARKTKTKCFCWEHINPAATSDYRFQGVCRKFGIRYADKLIVLTKSAKTYYLKTLKADENKVVQIYNPVLSAKTDGVYNAESKKIISAGRLCPQKNFEQLLDIAADVLPSFPDWTWDIYGAGEQKERLENKIERLNLKEQVCLKGQVDDLYTRYRDYAFLVMTSKYEGFPMTLLEGAAHGLPLISFDIQTGPDEIIEENKCGYLIEPENGDKMAEKIKKLIENPHIRLDFSAASAEKSNTFSLVKIMEQWKEVLW